MMLPHGPSSAVVDPGLGGFYPSREVPRGKTSTLRNNGKVIPKKKFNPQRLSFLAWLIVLLPKTTNKTPSRFRKDYPYLLVVLLTRLPNKEGRNYIYLLV